MDPPAPALKRAISFPVGPFTLRDLPHPIKPQKPASLDSLSQPVLRQIACLLDTTSAAALARTSSVFTMPAERALWHTLNLFVYADDEHHQADRFPDHIFNWHQSSRPLRRAGEYWGDVLGTGEEENYDVLQGAIKHIGHVLSRKKERRNLVKDVWVDCARGLPIKLRSEDMRVGDEVFEKSIMALGPLPAVTRLNLYVYHAWEPYLRCFGTIAPNLRHLHLTVQPSSAATPVNNRYWSPPIHLSTLIVHNMDMALEEQVYALLQRCGQLKTLHLVDNGRWESSDMVKQGIELAKSLTEVLIPLHLVKGLKIRGVWAGEYVAKLGIVLGKDDFMTPFLEFLELPSLPVLAELYVLNIIHPGAGSKHSTKLRAYNAEKPIDVPILPIPSDLLPQLRDCPSLKTIHWTTTDIAELKPAFVNAVSARIREHVNEEGDDFWHIQIRAPMYESAEGDIVVAQSWRAEVDQSVPKRLGITQDFTSYNGQLVTSESVLTEVYLAMEDVGEAGRDLEMDAAAWNVLRAAYPTQ